MPYTVGRSGAYDFDQVMICPSDTTLLAGESAGFAWNAIDSQYYYPSWDVVSNRSPSRVQVRVGGIDTFSDPQTFFTNAGTSPQYIKSQGDGIAWAPHNLALQSKTFTNAAWTSFHLTTTLSGTAPDGTATSYVITEDTTATVYHGLFATTDLVDVAGAVYTNSVYAKAGSSGTRKLVLNISDGTNQAGAVFDLTGGTILDHGTVASGVYITSSMVAVGSGWYRCSVTATVPGTGNSVAVWMHNGTTYASFAAAGYTGDGTSNMFVWGFQVNRGFLTPYVTTTSAAVMGVPISYQQGVLVEPAATNLVQQSQTLDNAYWTQDHITINANVAVAPDGATTAEKLVDDTSVGTNHDIFRSTGITITANATYTMSVYAKAAEHTMVNLALQSSGFTNGFTCDFDLIAGTTANGGILGTGTFTSAATTYVGNGWWRCSITGIVDNASTTASWAAYMMSAPATYHYNGDGVSGLYLWGAQLEAGSAATSYIPTLAATVTRSANGVTCSSSAIPTGASMSYFADLVEVATPGTPSVMDLVDSGVGNHEVLIYTSGLNVHQYNFQSGAGAAIDDVIGTFTVGQTFRCAARYQSNNFQGAVNGTLGTPSLTGTLASGYNTIGMGWNTATGYLDGFLRRVLIVPRAYSDTELKAKTT